MARRSKEEMEQTRLALLEAALNLFAEKGYSKTTLGDIAQRAGFTRGAVYWHFKDKAMVFHEVMKHYDAPVAELVGPVLAEISDPREWLEGLFSGSICALAEDDNLRKAMFVRVRKTEMPEELMGFYEMKQTEFVQIEQAIRVQIEKGVEQGVFRSDVNAVSVASVIMSLLMGLFGRIFTQSGPVPVSEADNIIDVFMRGIEV